MSCKELTPEQLKITNGCGSSYWAVWIFRIPKWVSKQFWRCCNRHDLHFQSGKSIIIKWSADDELYNCMYYSAYHSPPWQKYWKLKLADFIYKCLGTKLSMLCFIKATRTGSK